MGLVSSFVKKYRAATASTGSTNAQILSNVGLDTTLHPLSRKKKTGNTVSKSAVGDTILSDILGV